MFLDPAPVVAVAAAGVMAVVAVVAAVEAEAATEAVAVVAARRWGETGAAPVRTTAKGAGHDQ